MNLQKHYYRVRSGEAKASDLNVALQFLKDNGIEGLPAENTPLKELVDELPFEEAQGLFVIFYFYLETFTITATYSIAIQYCGVSSKQKIED